MSDAETRALGRAAVLILLASLARWGWDRAAPSPGGVEEGEAATLLARSRALADEEAARSRPLEPGERLDPNTASEAELDRLPGVGPATARAIVAYRAGHGPFRRIEELGAVRGVGAAALRRMGPHVALSEAPSEPSRGSHRAPLPVLGSAPGPTDGVSGPRVDVNSAPAAALEALPGIGPALARRIVATRSQRPFSTVEELERVPGIGPATVARLRPLVVVGR
jgi:competence protein ComEA